MPTPNRQFGQPMHLHDRFYGPVLSSLIQDLKTLGETRLKDPECAKIQNSLDQVCGAYRKLGDGSLLREKLLPELEAIGRSYHEWNDAHRNANGSVNEYRRDRLFFMKKGREQILQIVNRYQPIIETEFDVSFAAQLYQFVSVMLELEQHLPGLCQYLRQAQTEFLPGSKSPRLSRVAATKRHLDPIQEFRLCIRKIAGRHFVDVHLSDIDTWARENLGSISQERLRSFRSHLFREFQVALEHRPIRFDRLQELLDKCRAILGRS